MIPTSSGVDHGATRLIEHVAARVALTGAAYPLAAAVSLAVRGRHRLDQTPYANEIGVPVAAVRAAEAGELSLDQLPAPISARAAWLGVDLDALVDN